jgi:hypothetical protein
VAHLRSGSVGATDEVQDDLDRQMAEAEAAQDAWLDAERERQMADADERDAWLTEQERIRRERRLAEVDDAQHAYAAKWYAGLSPAEQRRIRADTESFAHALHGDRYRDAGGDPACPTAITPRGHVTARSRERRARTTRRTSAAAGASADDGPAPPPERRRAPDRRALPALTRAPEGVRT